MNDQLTIQKHHVDGDCYFPKFDYHVITITQLDGLGTILFGAQPLVIEVYGLDDPAGVPEVHYDFGMSYSVSVRPDDNWLYRYMSPNSDGSNKLETVIATIKFDLMHAFFHYKGDPNYTYIHWALYGILKDRVTITEEEFL
jgi:hypothetical protein